MRSYKPNKLAGLHFVVIKVIVRPDLIIIEVREIIPIKITLVHTSRLSPLRHPKTMILAESIALAAVGMDEFMSKNC
jgi:hypothetical protein